ncbi:hypothetical protein OG866_20710 [Streptomyces sp. NBC_00663]|uniref:hypothetical protein n=1 Tax=Streptomyces sp. NBC_00663 TaxID=2975801 RepID=UPI002E313F6F|nr:hypothetical protein [Streptomyces sp. NBC_00663]
MRNLSHIRRNALSSVAVAASLTLAASVAAIGTAHAAVKVTITGTVSCAKFDDSTPKIVTITPKKGTVGSDETPSEEQVEQYTIKLTGIPNSGTTVTAKVVCEDDEGDTNTYKVKDVPIKKPANGGPVNLNLPA